ncbi:MAG: ExbD/TolR family protein [Burkholderiales bacterium]|nr:ExbD/TolR family protein [Burkholderiales bacterium]
MARLHSRRAPMHEINVVPYADVMIVLLVIFMVTAPLAVPGVIELPSVERAPTAKPVPIEILIAEGGALALRERDAAGRVVAERPIAREDLPRLVKDPKTPVLVAGDRNVKYEAVIALLDELRAHGVERVGLQVKPRR